MISINIPMPNTCMNCPCLHTYLTDNMAIRFCMVEHKEIVVVPENETKDLEIWFGFPKPQWFQLVEDAITEEPEYKTGRWIKPTGMMPPEFHGHYECSECGEWAGRPWHRPWSGVVLSRHCPGCGIRMENADEEDVGEAKKENFK